MIPGSCTNDMLTIAERSNVAVAGKWVFRLDEVKTAGCIDEEENSSATDKLLRVSPPFLYTITRQPLELVGPCVDDDNNNTLHATCRFFDPKGNATEFDAQISVNGSAFTKFTCPTPFFYTTGVGLGKDRYKHHFTFTLLSSIFRSSVRPIAHLTTVQQWHCCLF
jgi:hypothetical protein